jgi:hypothetical protein
MTCVTVVTAVDCVTNEMLANTCPETEYRLDVCRATDGAILTSTEHIRNFVRSSVWKCIDFFNKLYD